MSMLMERSLPTGSLRGGGSMCGTASLWNLLLFFINLETDLNYALGYMHRIFISIVIRALVA